VHLVPGHFVRAGDAVIHRDLDGGLFLASGDLAASAPSGGLAAEDDRVWLSLDDGVLVGPAGLQVAFAHAAVALEAPRPDRRVEIGERSDREIAGLIARMKAAGHDPSREATILWERTTVPLLCLLLPLVALPLGLRWGGRPAWTMAVAGATWALIRTGDAACEAIGPAAAAALPLAGLALLAAVLWASWGDR
jgi:lipopolysaccharide export LptBFGC system permease protein LptF